MFDGWLLRAHSQFKACPPNPILTSDGEPHAETLRSQNGWTAGVDLEGRGGEGSEMVQGPTGIAHPWGMCSDRYATATAGHASIDAARFVGEWLSNGRRCREAL